MRKHFLIALNLVALFCSVLFFHSCQKGPDAAQPTRIDSTSNCDIPLDSMAVITTYFPGGSFCDAGFKGPALQKNVPLAPDNLLRLLIRVQKPGLWKVFTDSVNGVRFGGTGSYNSAATQLMYLQGYGTPKEAGRFAFKVIVGGVECNSLNLDFGPGNAAPPATTSNILPVANAGYDLVAVLPGPVKLIGSGFDGDGSVCGYQWTKISGPSAIVTNASKPTAILSGLVAGIYQFELKVTDNQGGSKKDTMKLTVRESDKAVFNLFSTDMQCAVSTQYGSLVVGAPPTADAFYAVEVNVTKPGPWTLSTQPVNGVTFSGSGTFTTPGLFNIHLLASGTPTAAAKYASAPFVEFPDCSLDVEIRSAPVTPPAATYYYNATIGGINYHQEANSDFWAGSGMDGADDVDFSADISSINFPPPANTTSLSVHKGLLHHYYSATDADFRGFFIPGSYPYTTGDDNYPYKNGNGVYINWTDPQGKLWSTTFGSHDQTGSTFSIISLQDAPDGVHLYVRVKMQFSCKLYKEGTGEMKQLTNGEMVSLFGKL